MNAPAAPIYPARHEEFMRILAAEADRAPVLNEGSVEEFLRISGVTQ